MATTDKYDRQLRLWGANGQRALMNSSILLIKADSVGTETLKNLVLPGVGSFTILDDFIVNHNDLGCNFFTTAKSLGKPRAEAVAELLCEMNSDVKGYARVANFQNVLSTEPDYFKSFNLIITANLPENQLLTLASLCWENRIPLLIAKSYGLIGTVRLQLRDHDIVESRSDSDRFDLRISKPFKELAQYCDSVNLDALDSMEHSHIPYIVILYKALQTWRSQHGGADPLNYAEKEAFKAQIKAMSRNFNNEVNFQEAVTESYRAYAVKTLGDDAMDVLRTKRNNATPLNSASKNFDFLVQALDLFLEENGGSIPLSGTIPDLTSSTDLYVQLQQVYQAKAGEDLRNLKSILGKLLTGVGLPLTAVSDEELETFCKNTLNLLNVSTRSVAEELSDTPDCGVVAESLQDELYDDPLQTPILWYLSLRATDRFHAKYARYPGELGDETLEADSNEVFSELKALCVQYGVDAAVIEGKDSGADGDKMSTDSGEGGGGGGVTAPAETLVTRAHAVEITRYGGCELQTIAALVGGIASQEAVKIITHQYVPLNNTYVFNGIASCGATYEL